MQEPISDRASNKKGLLFPPFTHVERQITRVKRATHIVEICFQVGPQSYTLEKYSPASETPEDTRRSFLFFKVYASSHRVLFIVAASIRKRR